MACARPALSHYLNHCWNIVNWTLRNKLQWNLIEILIFSFKKMLLKVSSVMLPPFCLGLNVLNYNLIICVKISLSSYHFNPHVITLGYNTIVLYDNNILYDIHHHLKVLIFIEYVTNLMMRNQLVYEAMVSFQFHKVKYVWCYLWASKWAGGFYSLGGGHLEAHGQVLISF